MNISEVLDFNILYLLLLTTTYPKTKMSAITGERQIILDLIYQYGIFFKMILAIKRCVFLYLGATNCMTDGLNGELMDDCNDSIIAHPTHMKTSC